jgi:FKBP-type peptidyl-prolyl cis-trans isomerase
MKAWASAASAALLLVGAAGVQAQELDTKEKELSYMFGMDIGSSLKAQEEGLNLDVLFDGIRAVYEGTETALTAEQAAAVRQAYIMQRQEAQAAAQAAIATENLALAEAFLAENAGMDGVITTDSGLQYQVIAEGDGPMPGPSDTVSVHYRGSLPDGTEFDSSYSRGQPLSIGVGQVIPGWTEGLQMMPVGSKFMFFIPPELGYGESGGGPIPPNSALIFEVELLDIEG